MTLTPTVSPLRPQTNACRSARTLNGVWELAREREGLDYRSGFTPEKRAAVPASLNDLFVDPGFRDHFGGVWLQRRFYAESATDRRWALHFGSAAYRAEVFVNGTGIGTHEGWATPFAFDISAALRFGEENLLCVRLDGTLSADTLPQGNLSMLAGGPGQFAGQFPDAGFDFYPYVGLHRSVTLYSTGIRAWFDQIALDPRGDLVTGEATLHVRMDVAGRASMARVRVPELGREVRIVLGEGGEVAIPLGKVEWWSPRSPRLYRCDCEVFDEAGRMLDCYSTRFGVRTVEVKPDGLYVNGERTCLRGFGLHEDFPVLGKGHHDAVMIRNFELLAWTGANSFRTTHYPYAEEVLDYADEQGVLVIDECAAVSVNFDFSTEATEAGHARSLTEMITRDRNHPCVIAWSLGNEGTSDHPRADAHFAAMAALSRQTDPTRPLTYITCRPEKDLALAHCDFVSINIYPGWYCLPGQIAAAVADAERTLRALHTRFDKPVLVTEFGADAIAGFHDLPAGQWSEDYQAELIVALSRKLHELPFVFGQHIWNLFDFRTAQHHIRASGNRKGVFTRERQPKLAARAVREEWARQRETGPR